MGVPLSQIAQHVPDVTEIVGPDVLISDVVHDSREATTGTLFVAIPGENHDGHDFVTGAVESGASAILVERAQPVGVPQIVVPDARKAMAFAARAVFGMPDKHLAIAGVTGTNGKTTVTHMLESILTTAGVSVGVVGTLGARIGTTPIPTARTTPEATDLQRILGTMRDAGVRVVLIEVSSHAIELHRSDAIHFSVVGFTNLSQDHLDFHGDMEAYFAVKSRLFDSDTSDRGVINIGDQWGERLHRAADLETTTVSIAGDADVSVVNLGATAGGTSFRVVTSEDFFDVQLPLIGDFNVSNALVASGMALELGMGPSAIATGLCNVEPIRGRMEVVAHDGPFTVVVDYAHTPDAIAVVLGSLRRLAQGRVISLIGAGGDRDSAKRSIMGAIAARMSDVTLITTDNPRNEDPHAIADEIFRGADAQPNADVEIIIDRRAAIRRGISMAETGDIVVVLGKGHEQGQEAGGVTVPFDDRQEVREALRLMDWHTR
ncbi:MAG: UDP-N-acetylmuramoyl-L-alanyl-D-glutamate--2,6-diaminopimelate ligase [Actinomycetia bacterium]|nr:UDP-N-acetylmuramoyl-L-alanyl-D-glutamate--2,6-diaminopimelate ligase [Actinomycetes bacterium]